MKAKTLKQIVSIVSLCVLATASPLIGQAQETDVQYGVGTRTQTEMNEPAGADTEGTNWSWLGLLGLIGLFGLKRRRDVHEGEYRTGTARA